MSPPSRLRAPPPKRDGQRPGVGAGTSLQRRDQALDQAARAIRLLAAVTPTNAESERHRLLDSFARGTPAEPHWTYPRQDLGPLRRGLDALIDALTDDDDLLAPLYRARAMELALEAAIAEAAGTEALGELARTRFRSPDAGSNLRARELALAWSTERDTPPEPGEPELRTDAETKGSLLHRMREEVSRRRWPFAVVVAPSLVALAATGDRHIFVAAGRLVTAEDVERTVFHELEGHALPRVRAAGSSLGLLRTGTARGVDDQEGFALVLEERHGFLSPRRRRELAARHLATTAMDEGASFAEIVEKLRREHGSLTNDAVRVAERVYRGSRGRGPGLGRERIYIESFLRVREALDEAPGIENILASGQVGLDAVATLDQFDQELFARAVEP